MDTYGNRLDCWMVVATTKHVTGDRPQDWLALALCLRVLGIRYDLGPRGLRGTYPDPHAYLLISIAHVDQILLPRAGNSLQRVPGLFLLRERKTKRGASKKPLIS